MSGQISSSETTQQNQEQIRKIDIKKLEILREVWKYKKELISLTSLKVLAKYI